MKLGMNWGVWKSKVFWMNFLILIVGAFVPDVKNFVEAHPQDAVYVWSILNIILRFISHGKIELTD
jgi:hypothetical protein